MLASLVAAVLAILMMSSMTDALTADQAAVFAAQGLEVIETDTHYLINTDGVPDHEYGPFPSRGNPNEVSEQDHMFMIPKNPVPVDPPGCVSMGSIGVAINGVPLFNPYTAQGYNAVEGEYREIFDDCDGHPQEQGAYHYHKIPSCLFQGTNMELLAVANDGYPVYGPLDENGRNLTSADLDFCHGRFYNGDYVYHMTYDFPYIIGCYHGAVENTRLPPDQGQGMRTPPPGQDPGGQTPPPGRTLPPGFSLPGGNDPAGFGAWSCVYVNETNPGMTDEINVNHRSSPPPRSSPSPTDGDVVTSGDVGKRGGDTVGDGNTGGTAIITSSPFMVILMALLLRLH